MTNLKILIIINLIIIFIFSINKMQLSENLENFSNTENEELDIVEKEAKDSLSMLNDDINSMNLQYSINLNEDWVKLDYNNRSFQIKVDNKLNWILFDDKWNKIWDLDKILLDLKINNYPNNNVDKLKQIFKAYWFKDMTPEEIITISSFMKTTENKKIEELKSLQN